MTLLYTPRFDAFARSIALGWPPVLAAKRAGYRNLRASRAMARLVTLQAVAAPEEARAPAAKTGKAAD
jgi:hypothetical protein